MLVTTYGLAKTGLRVTQFLVAIDQSGACLRVVMGFLGRVGTTYGPMSMSLQ